MCRRNSIQVQVGGDPIQLMGGGTPSQVWVWGTPTSRTGGGIPSPRLDGVPPVRRQSSIASTCYVVYSMPLAFNFLVSIVYNLVIPSWTFGFFTIKKSDAFLSEYLTDLKLHRTKIFCQKLPPVGFEPTTSGSWTSCSANCASKKSVEDLWSELSFFFMHHFTCWTLFISGINRAWLDKGLSDSHRQPNSDLAQWQSMRLIISRLGVQTPLGAIFDEIYFVLCNFRSVR